MIVHFLEPPPIQRLGGLEAANRSLESYLQRHGITVVRDSRIDVLGRSGEQEVVHFHGLWQPQYLRASAHCRRMGVPYVVSPHGMLEPWAWRHKRWKKWPWFWLFERRHIAGAARLLSTGAAEAQNLRQFFPDAQCAALPLGLTSPAEPEYNSARERLGWDQDERVLLFLSRIHPKKGLDVLLQSLLATNVAATRRVRLVIVGDGAPKYREALRALAHKEAHRLPRLEWQGEVWGDEKWAYLQGADLLCLPSFSENFGLVILEALQVGTPVVTSTRTPWSSIASWGAGWVVEPTIADVRGALTSFLNGFTWSLAQREELAARVHRDFSWTTVGPSYLQLYHDVLNGNLRKCRLGGRP